MRPGSLRAGTEYPRTYFGKTAAVPDAELSSLAATLEDVKKRVVLLADTKETGGQGDLAHELYEVERSLNAAIRRMNRLLGF